MICNRCGNEFGAGVVCQYCGTDKVSALGEFNGYSVPKRTANIEQSTSADPSPCHVASPYIDTIPSHVAFPRVDNVSSLICWKCGEVIPGDSKFCPVCSTLLFVTCPSCGHKYSAKYLYCNQCGTNRETYQAVNELNEWLRGRKEINLRAGEAELQRKRQEEALRQEEQEKQARLHEAEKINEFSRYKQNSCPIEIPNDTAYHLAFAYIRKMANYLELETFFINLAYKAKRDHMEQYIFDHHIIDSRVENVVEAIVKDKTYWNRRDCLDMTSLEEECVLAYTFVNENLTAVY